MADTTCDVAVVGGGLVGSALAYELADAGVDVLLVDRHDEGRATDAGAGILSPETNQNPDDAWFGFAAAAARHHRTLAARLAAGGIVHTGFERCGLLSVATQAGEDDWFEALVRLAGRRAPEAVHEIGPGEAGQRFPPLGPVRRALYSTVAARVDGRRLTRALGRAATARQLRRLHAGVTRLQVAGDRIVGLETGGGVVVACAGLAIAGGAWSDAFAGRLGVSIPVRPVKGQIVHLRLGGADTAAWPIVQPVLNHDLVAWPGGRVACGGTFEADAGFDVRPTAAGLGELLRECVAVAPGLAAATVLETRVGLRPVTPDDQPVLGPLPGWSNVHVATGHGANGLLLGPYSAALVAAGILGRRPDADLAPYSAGRFA